MTFREAAVVISSLHQPLYWHVPDDRTATSIPDSRELWLQIWTHRQVLLGVAHTHPGGGNAQPSRIDLETFESLEAGLGRKLHHWVVNEVETRLVLRQDDGTYQSTSIEDPPWVEDLRRYSQDVTRSTIEAARTLQRYSDRAMFDFLFDHSLHEWDAALKTPRNADQLAQLEKEDPRILARMLAMMFLSLES
jgi:hypothetical protein